MIALICWNTQELKKKIKTQNTTKNKKQNPDFSCFCLFERTSKLRTMALSRPNIVEGYDKRGSRIRRSLAWIWTRCIIAYLSTSRTVFSPLQSIIIQFLEAVFFFTAACGSAGTMYPSRPISPYHIKPIQTLQPPSFFSNPPNTHYIFAPHKTIPSFCVSDSLSLSITPTPPLLVFSPFHFSLTINQSDMATLSPYFYFLNL